MSAAVRKEWQERGLGLGRGHTQPPKGKLWGTVWVCRGWRGSRDPSLGNITEAYAAGPVETGDTKVWDRQLGRTSDMVPFDSERMEIKNQAVASEKAGRAFIGK